MKKLLILILVVSCFLTMGFAIAEEGGGTHGIDWKGLSTTTAVLACVPFILLLLCIAFFPLMFEHWWHKNSNKAIISLVLGIPVAGWFLFADSHTLLHTFI